MPVVANYIYYYVKNFRKDKNIFDAYTSNKKLIEKCINTTKKYGTKEKQIRQMMTNIMLYQTIGKNFVQIEDTVNKYSQKQILNDQDKIREACEKAFLEAGKEVANKLGPAWSSANNTFDRDPNVKQKILSNMPQSISSPNEKWSAIITGIFQYIQQNSMPIEYRNNNWGYGDIYNAINNFIKDQTQLLDFDKAVSFLGDAIKNTFQKWQAQMLKKKSNSVTQVISPDFDTFLNYLRGHLIDRNFNIAKFTNSLNKTIYSDFQEKLITEMCNQINVTLNNSFGKATTTSKLREDHYYPEMKWSVDSNGKTNLKVEKTIINSAAKQIKTDVTIELPNPKNKMSKDKRNRKKSINLSLKFYDIAIHDTIHLQDGLTIGKVLDFSKNDRLISYNNFLSEHPDEDDNYKQTKQEAMYYLELLMLIRAWTGLGYSGFSRASKSNPSSSQLPGPPGFLIVQDSTNGNCYIINIGKTLENIYVNNASLDEWFTPAGGLRENFSFAKNEYAYWSYVDESAGANYSHSWAWAKVRSKTTIEELNRLYKAFKLNVGLPVSLLIDSKSGFKV